MHFVILFFIYLFLRQSPSPLHTQTPTSQLPLQGIEHLNFTKILAPPTCQMVFSKKIFLDMLLTIDYDMM